MSEPSEKAIHNAARKLTSLQLLIRLATEKASTIESSLKQVVQKRQYKGLVLCPGNERCSPHWTQEFITLCERMKLDSASEVLKVKERVGKKAGESKLVIDETLSPDSDTLEKVLTMLEEI